MNFSSLGLLELDEEFARSVTSDASSAIGLPSLESNASGLRGVKMAAQTALLGWSEGVA